ncbi:GbNV_gp97-like [Fopius arisanus]|nr:GbNV_gp97-like [Fopius arisanus]
MEIFYDETIFTDGSSFKNYDAICMTNEADRYLVNRLQLHSKIVSFMCNDDMKGATSPVFLNPRVPGRGINIFTLDATNKQVLRSAPFNQILITNALRNSVPITIKDHDPQKSAVYTVGYLNPLESAIMIKYYAMHHQIRITPDLQAYIESFFNDTRSWFRRDYAQPGPIQKPNGEVVDASGNLLQLPDLSFSSPEVDIQ